MSVPEEPEYGWDSTDYFQKLHSLILEYGGAEVMRDNRTDLLWNMCPTYFNKTESIRLVLSVGLNKKCNRENSGVIFLFRCGIMCSRYLLE